MTKQLIELWPGCWVDPHTVKAVNAGRDDSSDAQDRYLIQVILEGEWDTSKTMECNGEDARLEAERIALRINAALARQ